MTNVNLQVSHFLHTSFILCVSSVVLSVMYCNLMYVSSFILKKYAIYLSYCSVCCLGRFFMFRLFTLYTTCDNVFYNFLHILKLLNICLLYNLQSVFRLVKPVIHTLHHTITLSYLTVCNKPRLSQINMICYCDTCDKLNVLSPLLSS